MAVCDFCYAPDPPHTFPAIDFWVEDPIPGLQPMRSEGGFMACDTCERMIREEKRRELEDYCLRMFFKRHPEVPNLVEDRVRTRRIIRAFHDQFWAARIRIQEGN